MTTLVNLCLLSDASSARDVAEQFCRKFGATPLKGGSTGWGVRGRFFPASVSDSTWNSRHWYIEGLTSTFGFDVNTIFSRLSSCKDYADYRETMEELNHAYSDGTKTLGPDKKLHSRENNWFWNKFRYDIAESAMAACSCVVWLMPKNLADATWQRR